MNDFQLPGESLDVSEPLKGLTLDTKGERNHTKILSHLLHVEGWGQNSELGGG